MSLFFGFKAGNANVVIYMYAQKNAADANAGDPKTGLVFNSAGISASYIRPASARVAIVLVTQTAGGVHTDGGFVEVEATNCPGLYRLDLPDAAVATGADYVIIHMKADTTVFVPVIVMLPTNTSTDNQDELTSGTHGLAVLATSDVGGGRTDPRPPYRG